MRERWESPRIKGLVYIMIRHLTVEKLDFRPKHTFDAKLSLRVLDRSMIYCDSSLASI